MGLIRFFGALVVLIVLFNLMLSAKLVPSVAARGRAPSQAGDAGGAPAAPARESPGYAHQPAVVVRECLPREPTVRVTRPLHLLRPALDRCAPGAAAALCAAAARVQRDGGVLLVPVAEALLDDWASFATAARTAGATALIALALPTDGAAPHAVDADAERVARLARARADGVGAVVAWSAALAPPGAGPSAAASAALELNSPLLGGAAALDAARVLLLGGLRVVLIDPRVALVAEPLAHVRFDHDVAARSALPGPERRGQVVSVDDNTMGWSRFAQSLAVTHLAPELLALAPTAEAAALCARVSRTLRGTPSLATVRLAAPAASRALALEHALTAEALTPSHDSWRSVGASVRLLPSLCYGGAPARGLVSTAPALPEGPRRVGREDPNALLRSAAHDAAPAVLRSQCAAELPHAEPARRAEQAAEDEALEAAGAPRRARPLNFVLESHAVFPPPAVCAARGLQALCAVLAAVAGARREALVAVSNKNILPMLQLYIDGVKRAKVSNALVVALDDETGAWLAARAFPAYVKKLVARGGSTDNHATSGLKFRLLQEFMVLGCSVLLSDVDIAWMRDPFPALYGDADVEGMTDGFDDVSAYGAPGSAALGGGRSAFRIFARNSGMFYLAATNESLRMMERMAHRMATENIWDQTAYNEEQFYLSAGDYQSLGLSQRVMNYLCFLNTKVLFKYIREEPMLYPDAYTPIGAHVNYHPEKPQRMVDIFKHYQQGERGVLERWNGGEGLRISNECKFSGVRPGSPQARSDPLLAAVLGAGKAEWGGVRWIRFGADGRLTTPWGDGSWGGVPGDKAGTAIWLDFFSQTRHLLRLESGAALPSSGEPFTLHSMRCTDGDKVAVRIVYAAE